MCRRDKENAMNRIILAVCCLLLSVGLAAETFNPLAFREHAPSFSLLNPNKLSMSNEVSFSSGMASGGTGYYSSMYTNNLAYQFNPKLKMNVSLHFLNQGTMTHQSGFNFQGNDDNNTRILPDMQLEYNPSANTSIRLEFRTYNPYYNDLMWPY
jgi:hypothetical protein